MKKITTTALIYSSLIGICVSCSDTSTNTSVNSEVLGTWMKKTTDTIDVLDDTAGFVGKTQSTETYTMEIIDGGILKTTIKFEYIPQIASAQNSEITYTGTWHTSHDTLYRDTYPSALGSLDTSKYEINYNTLTLNPIRTTSFKTFTKIK